MSAALAMDAFSIRKRAALSFDHPLPHMQEYLIEKEAQQIHPQYLAGIRQTLAHFSNFMHNEIQPPVRYLEQIERVHLVMFQSWLSMPEQGYSKGYSTELLKRLRSWFNWLVDCQYLTVTPWVAIKIRTIAKTPNPLSDDELDTLFSAHRRSAFNTDPFVFHRREIILTLLYGWGLRINELCSLAVPDMDMRLDYVRVRNKGGGYKTEPYNDMIKSVVARWLAIRARKSDPSCDALIIKKNGQLFNENDVYTVIADLGHSCGVRVNPHRLRDTCGTHLLDSDVPVERVAAILGHSDIKRTLQYSRVNNHKVSESHAAAMDPRLQLLINGFARTSQLKDDGELF